MKAESEKVFGRAHCAMYTFSILNAYFRDVMHRSLHDSIHRPINIRVIPIVMLLCASLMAISFSNSVFAQAPQTAEAIMRPSSGEIAGELAKGELLVTALKREKIDSNSARQAMQSIGKLFDFRLSRTGDRYVYRVANGRKLTMLRYQRGQHVYEAVLDKNTGEFNARLLEVEVSPDIPVPILENDEDGEVDVEHAAMAEQIQNNAPPAEDIPSTGSIFDAPQPMPVPSDPPLPEDAALAGIPSPDADFPDAPESDLTIPEANADPNGLPEEEEDERLHAPVIQQDNPNPEPENTIIPSVPALQDTQFTPTPIVKKVEVESTVFSTISITMLVLGLLTFLASFIIFILPGIQARKRCTANGLIVRNMVRISPSQRLALVEHDGHGCVIGIERHSMTYIAPCPVDDPEFWKRLNAKTYWHQMAQKPLSDRQLASLITQMNQPKTQSKTHISQEKATINEVHEESKNDSTAILAADIENELLSRFDEDEPEENEDELRS